VAPARRPAAPDDDPEEPGGAGPAAAPAPEPEAQKITIQLDGNPSFFVPDPELGTLKERFTICRREGQKLTFVANAIVAKALDEVSPELDEHDILDWAGFCAALHARGAPPSGPGAVDERQPHVARLWELLPPEGRAVLEHRAQGKVLNDTHKRGLIGALNQVLARRELYRPQDFRGVDLCDEAKALARLAREAMADKKLRRLNRLLLEAAFPREIARIRGKVEGTIEPMSDLCFVKGQEEPTAIEVREGDVAATRFFLLRGMKVKAVEGVMTKDKTGFPVEATPPHLDVELSVAAIHFIELQPPKAAKKRPAAPKTGGRHGRPL
jgi:hypothetical protein